jgi:putative MATE family efflux protein
MAGCASVSRHRRILALALPAVGALVADPILGLVDTAVAGRLGPVPLAALGLGVAVVATVSWVFNFLVYGTTAAVARAVGAGDRDAAGRRVVHASWVAVGLGVAVGLAVFAGARPLLHALGIVEEIIDPAVVYLQVRAVGIPALLLGFVGHGAFRGVSDTRTPMWIVIGANVVNAALDIVLVFGFGFGLAGIAWATVAAEVGVAGAFAILLHRAGLPLAGHGLPSGADIRVLAVVSRDLFLRTGALLLGLFVVTAAAARVGTVTAAAHQVIWQVWITVSLLMDGFAIAAQAMVGTALGAGDRAEARAVARALVRWGLFGGIAVGAVLVIVGTPLARVFTADAAVLTTIAAAWWLAMGGHAMNGLVFVLDGVFMGAGDFAFLRNWAIAGALVAAVSAQVAVAAEVGLVWLWVGLQAMMAVRLAGLLWRLRGEDWLAVGAGLP